jgi:hypothetical protein
MIYFLAETINGTVIGPEVAPGIKPSKMGI